MKQVTYIQSLVLIFAFVTATATSQEENRDYPQTLGPRHFNIPAPRDPASVHARIGQIDKSLNIWRMLGLFTLGDPYEGLNAETSARLKKVLDDRAEQRSKNRSKLEPHKFAELQPIPDDERGNEALRRLQERYGPPNPDDDIDALLLDYQRTETEAEKVLASTIAELLTPEEQAKFLRLPAISEYFLAHPMGAEFFGFGPSLQAELRKRIQLYYHHMDERNKERKVLPPSPEHPLMRIVLPPMTADDYQRRHAIYELLTLDELERYLRLKGAVRPHESLDDWFARMPDDERAVARRMLLDRPPNKP